MNEQWRDVVGYEGIYSVSDHGRVRSEARTVTRADGGRGTERKVSTRILRQNAHYRSGHMRVGLSLDGVQEIVNVHQLMLAAFIGPCPPGMESLHWDDNPANNILSNLRYGTPSENMADRIRNGRHHPANKTHCLRGHEFTAENTLVSSGRRRCRTCKRQYERVKDCA